MPNVLPTPPEDGFTASILVSPLKINFLEARNLDSNPSANKPTNLVERFQILLNTKLRLTEHSKEIYYSDHTCIVDLKDPQQSDVR